MRHPLRYGWDIVLATECAPREFLVGETGEPAQMTPVSCSNRSRRFDAAGFLPPSLPPLSSLKGDRSCDRTPHPCLPKGHGRLVSARPDLAWMLWSCSKTRCYSSIDSTGEPPPSAASGVGGRRKRLDASTEHRRISNKLRFLPVGIRRTTIASLALIPQ